MRKHVGEWADSPKAAIDGALADVMLDVAEGWVMETGGGMRWQPCDESKTPVEIEVAFSENRQQYRAVLHREGVVA